MYEDLNVCELEVYDLGRYVRVGASEYVYMYMYMYKRTQNTYFRNM